MKHLIRIVPSMVLTVVTATARLADADDTPVDPLVGVLGQRVRVSDRASGEGLASGRTRDGWVGIIESYDGDTLTVLVEGLSAPVKLRRHDVKRLEVGRGVQSRWRSWAARGAMAGAVIGLVPAGVCAGNYDACKDEGLTPALYAPVVFGAIGGALGGIIGAAVRGERWEEVKGAGRASWNLTPVPGGMAMSVSFPVGNKHSQRVSRDQPGNTLGLPSIVAKK